MYGSKEDMRYYLDCISSRDVDKHKKELIALYDLDNKQEEMQMVFTKCIISKNDKIFPPENLQAYWMKQNVEIKEIEAAHFPFNKFASFKEIIEC